MIEVFKTNIRTRRDASHVIMGLKTRLPHSKINIDLMDCDKVLRIEDRSHPIDEKKIIEWVNQFDFKCEVLDS